MNLFIKSVILDTVMATKRGEHLLIDRAYLEINIKIQSN